MRYGTFRTIRRSFDTNIRPGHIWEWDEDYPIIRALDALDFIPAGACFRFLSAIPIPGAKFTGSADLRGVGLCLRIWQLHPGTRRGSHPNCTGTGGPGRTERLHRRTRLAASRHRQTGDRHPGRHVGHHGHEPNSIAMLLSGAARAMDWSEVDARVMQIAREVAEQGMGAGMSLTMSQRKRLREGRRYLGNDKPGLLDRISPETWAMLTGVLFAVIGFLGIWGIVG